MNDNWQHKDAKVDLTVDDLLAIFIEQEAPEVACEAMNGPFRSFVHWLHAAHRAKADPQDVRKSLLAIISSMIMETSKRMGEIDEEGRRVPMEVWIGELVLDLRDELIHDLDTYQRTIRRPPGH